MGETVDALGYKADVPARAKESVSEKVDSLKAKVTGVGSHVSEATPDADELRHGAGQAVGVVQEIPIGLAVGAAAVGFLAGMLIPSTKVENERIGPIADQVKEQARQTGEEAVEHGKQIAQETAATAGAQAQEAVAAIKDQAQESAQAHAQSMGESAKESAEQLQQETAPSAR
jgi:gas vesicle protein